MLLEPNRRKRCRPVRFCLDTKPQLVPLCVVKKMKRDEATYMSRRSKKSQDQTTRDHLQLQLMELLRVANASMTREGWVYMIPTVRMIENHYYCKIGFSNDPPERVKSLCTNNPHALDLARMRAFRGNLCHESTLKILTCGWSTDAGNEWRKIPKDVIDIFQLLPLFYATDTIKV